MITEIFTKKTKSESFDRITAVGFVEHVGTKNYENFF
jgi:cyclopropane fatty-acyl-phospholipid synthase-like methyltransferase